MGFTTCRYFVHVGFLLKIMVSNYNGEGISYEGEVLAIMTQGQLYFSLGLRGIIATGLCVSLRKLSCRTGTRPHSACRVATQANLGRPPDHLLGTMDIDQGPTNHMLRSYHWIRKTNVAVLTGLVKRSSVSRPHIFTSLHHGSTGRDALPIGFTLTTANLAVSLRCGTHPQDVGSYLRCHLCADQHVGSSFGCFIGDTF